ncbi:polysaccharide lyase family 8 super-sandwich domain-containing protein [Pontiellaceae bacterium B1224]|nr:polysaccharide lyase family 8 super-sandwich domain-containing protein [Pontiellaceae bacterium B1224]
MKNLKPFFFACILSLSAFGGNTNDLSALRQGIVEVETGLTAEWLATGRSPALFYSPEGRFDFPIAVKRDDLDGFLQKLQPDGSFNDIDYTSVSRSGWVWASHFDRVRKLAIAINTYPEAEVQAKNLNQAFHSTLGWWIKENPTCPNWWYNEICMPRFMGVIGTLMWEEMSPEERNGALAIIDRTATGATGQNRLWRGINVMLQGMLKNDPELAENGIVSGAETISAEVAIEGIQPDWSFRQHGPQFYQGNYGHHFLLNTAYLLRVLHGSEFEVSAEKQAVIENLALEGTRWMMWGSLLDYAAWGRQISYENRVQGPPLLGTCDALIAIKPGDTSELQAWRESIISDTPLSSLLGTRFFWRSDYGVMRQPELMATVKMCSTRTLSTEICNDENLLGAFLCEGMTLLYRDGGEYDRIFPVWDWNRLPGVTSRPTAPMPDPSEWSEKPGATAFVGGISGDDSGAMVMEARRFGVAADKVWVNGPNGILILTGNISSEADEPVFTTINQCLLKGDVLKRSIDGKTAVWHDGLAYFFVLGDDKVVIEQGEQSGDWRDLRTASTDGEAKADVFLLGVDHGAKPTNAQTACWVSPMTEADFQTSGLPTTLKILQNTPEFQALELDGICTLAFHKPGSIQIDGLGTVAVDVPCLMSLKKEGRAIQIAVADPTQTQASLQMTFNGETQTIELPQGANAGSTITKSL